MTLRDLIKEIKLVDEDILDKPITIVLHRKLEVNTLLTIRGIVSSVDENTEPNSGNIVFRIE